MHEIAWFARQGAKLAFDHVWVIEQDVAWQGNLFDSFATFADWRQDLLCYRHYNDTFASHQVRERLRISKRIYELHSATGWVRKIPDRHKCMIFMVRYSWRMLDTLQRDFMALGHWAHGEWFAATVCRFQLGGFATAESRDSPCTLGDYANQTQLYKPRSFSHKTASRLTKANFQYALDKPPQWIHAVKW